MRWPYYEEKKSALASILLSCWCWIHPTAEQFRTRRLKTSWRYPSEPRNNNGHNQGNTPWWCLLTRSTGSNVDRILFSIHGYLEHIVQFHQYLWVDPRNLIPQDNYTLRRIFYFGVINRVISCFQSYCWVFWVFLFHCNQSLASWSVMTSGDNFFCAQCWFAQFLRPRSTRMCRDPCLRGKGQVKSGRDKLMGPFEPRWPNKNVP